MSICNFRCHYCYLAQRPVAYQGIQPEKIYSPEQVARALSYKRLGGTAYINVCADGETLLVKDLEFYLKKLVEEGHYIEIITNCSLTSHLQKFLSWNKDFLKHVEFKCSFHYLELKKHKLLDTFAKNVNSIWEAGSSANIEITPSDELIPYIDEIKSFSMKNFGALPHITIGRDERTAGIDVLTNLSKEEYYKIWSQFDSKFFEFKWSIFGKRQERFCYAGLWTTYVNLCDGNAFTCYNNVGLKNIFENPDSELPSQPVGKCNVPHCFNGHAFLTFDAIPGITKFTYNDMRNRVKKDGKCWLQPEIAYFFSSKLSDSNRELSDAEKMKYLIMNRLNI